MMASSGGAVDVVNLGREAIGSSLYNIVLSPLAEKID
jgi:hypothetical protein